MSNQENKQEMSQAFQSKNESTFRKKLMEFLTEVIPDEMDLHNALLFWSMVLRGENAGKQKKIIVLRGEGKNGKSTLLRLIEEVFKMQGRNVIHLNPNVFEKIKYLMQTDTRFLNKNALAISTIPPHTPISKDILEYFAGDEMYFGNKSKPINCSFALKTNWADWSETFAEKFGEHAIIINCSNTFNGVLNYHAFSTDENIVKEMRDLLFEQYDHNKPTPSYR